MTARLAAIVAATTLALSGLACQAIRNWSEDDRAVRVAEVNGDTITADELEAWIREDLYRRAIEDKSAGEVYELRADFLGRMIDERILEDESSQRGMTAEALLEQEVEALGPVTDEEVESFYADNQERLGDRTLEQLGASIRRFLQERRSLEAMARLREQGQVTVYLERPRLEVVPDGASLGPADARVTIVEFSDFQCPYCKRAEPVLAEVRERYPDDVRLIYRHFPLDRIHPRARAAAEASECARAQDKFWPYHEKLFTNPDELRDDDLRRYAQEVELDLEAFEQCVSERSFQEKVEADVAAGSAAGVSGTPFFFVNGIPLSGAQPVESFLDLIEAELAHEASGS